MARPHEDPLDVGLLAAQQTELVREFPVREFERLQDRLSRPEGRATVSLHFRVVAAHAVADGHLEARVWLECQRCLGDYEAEIRSEIRLAFVDSDDAAMDAPEGYEAVTTAAGRVRLAELVEDEMLLALPLVPMHAQPEQCGAPVATRLEPAAPVAPEGPTQRPFAGLQDLLKR